MLPLRDNIPSSRTPVVNYLIIATCVLVYLWQLGDKNLHVEFALNPSHLIRPDATGEPYTLTLVTVLTSMFMHGGLFHLLGNMLFLWIFGDNVEDRMGHLRYLLFYVICGTVATFSHALISLFAPVPVLGASGAIAGVLGAYFILFRGATVRTLVILVVFVTVVDLPAVLFLGLWFVFQFFTGLGTIGGAGGGVAVWAHVGGFVAGLWLVRYFAVIPRRTLPRPRVLDVRY
ncbi:MAG: rhomboid family intramembrane serine protease [Armatimonadetes bacterium]|nr:rhomboid family intramembrane serine protease [Armatimonadota bacterium]